MTSPGPLPPPSAPSFWLSRRRPPQHLEYAVVGGGLVGLSTAYWLARAGHRVTVLEAGNLAGRASGRNAGFLLTGSAEPFVTLAKAVGEEAALGFWRLSRENRDLLRAELLDPGLVECEFVAEGSWIAALDDDEQVGLLRASAERLEAAGFELRWVEGEELRRASGSKRLGGALHQPRDGGLDPVALARGIATAGGFEVRTGLRIRGLEPCSEGIRLTADGGDLVARRLVVAVNAYAPALLPHLAGTVRPVRGQMLATAPGPRPLSGVWYIDDGFQYLRQLPDGTVLLGGCRQVALEEEVGFREEPNPKVQAELDRFLEDAFPGLAGREVVRRWAGIMAFTDEGLPRVGEVPDIPGAFFAAGLSGHGLSLGFALGRHLARCAAGEAEPSPVHRAGGSAAGW